MQSLFNKKSIAGGGWVLVICIVLIILIVAVISFYKLQNINFHSPDYLMKIRLLNLSLYLSVLSCFMLVTILFQKLVSLRRQQKDSDLKFISLLEAIKEATFVVSEKGYIQFTNKPAESLFGYSNNELKDQPVELLLPREYFVPPFYQSDASAIDTNLEIYEIIIVNKRGKASQAELSLCHIKSYNQLFHVATINLPKEDKKDDAKFHSLLNAAPDATIIVNGKGLIETINQQTINVFGYNRDEIIGQPIEILIPPDARIKRSHDRKEFMKGTDRRVMGSELDLTALRKNGTHFPVEISLSPIKMDENVLVVASVRDVSDRMNKNEELRKSEERFQLLVNSIKDYAIFLIDLEGSICTWNAGAENVLGYSAAEILGKPIDIFYTKQEVEKGEPFKDLEKTSITGHHEAQRWRLRKNGSSFCAHNVFKGLKDSNGKVYAYTQITHEIEEVK